MEILYNFSFVDQCSLNIMQTSRTRCSYEQAKYKNGHHIVSRQSHYTKNKNYDYVNFGGRRANKIVAIDSGLGRLESNEAKVH